MKEVLNFIIVVVILGIASWIAPGCVHFDSLRSLLLAALLLFVAEFIVVVVGLFAAAATFIAGNFLGAFSIVAGLLFFGELLAIKMVDGWMKTASFTGTWTVIALAFFIAVLRIPETPRR
jgi:hypothetical protein